MNKYTKSTVLAGMLGASTIALAMAMSTSAFAQVTTSSMRGSVKTDTGAAVAGATASITHVPSGRTTTAFTNSNGVFSARNLRVGGPYTVVVSGSDFGTKTYEEIFIGLDNTYPLDVVVSQSGGDDIIIVTGALRTQDHLDTGLSTNFTAEQINKVSSIDRDIADVAQLDPFANINLQSGGSKELTIAGANNRFNSLTIDGVALNDRFGLNANGYPTQRSPIPFEAIQALSIETAPYDTEYNGFTGGTINVVTKSGENEIHGSAAYYYTSDSIAGNKIRGDDVNNEFKETSYAFSLGGPIIKDKLFIYGAYEKYNEVAALINGPSGVDALNEITVTTAEIDQIVAAVQNVWGFDAGDFTVPPVEEEKYIISVDWNVNNNHRAKFTWLHNNGASIRQTTGNSFLTDGTAQLGLSSTWYNRAEKVDSYIGHVYSDWTSNFSTELKVAFTKQATGQDSLNGAEFPLFSIRISEAERGTDCNNDDDLLDICSNVSLGPDTFRHGNSLDQEFFQIKAKAEWTVGDHIFKVGVEKEKVDINNLFALGSEGMYFFNSIADLENAQANSLLYFNAITNNEDDLRALWGYALTSIYLQDVWDITDNVTLQLGLRNDSYTSEGTIRANALFESRYGYTNTTDIDGLSVLMPRFSFNWNAADNIKVRGGIGVFSGGSPSVWLSNAYSNDGVNNGSEFAFQPTVPTVPDPVTGNYIPSAVQDALANLTPDGPVAALHPSFGIPKTMKANLGVAYEADIPFMGDEWLLTADVLYNEYKNAPYWFDQSCVATSTAPDGRPVYTCGGGGEPEATVVSSVDLGNSLLFAVTANKNWETDFGDFDLFLSYTHADVNDIGQGTSSTATSNYSDTPRFDFQNPTVGTSNFQVEHSFKLRASWEKEFIEDYATKVSLFATRRSGQPYSYTFATDTINDVFGIREGRADDAGALFYVPTGPNDPLFSSASFDEDAALQAAFFDYINSSELAQYRGSIAPRNGDNSRWTTIANLKIEQELPGVMAGHKSSVFVTLQNFGNMLDSDWGVIERVRYEYEQAVASASIVNGQYVYDSLDTTLNQEILTNSLWSAQFGIKYKF